MKPGISLLFTLILILSQSTFAQLPTYVPTNGLQGYWPFTGNANDVSGNNYNGTVNGCPLVNDRFGNANEAYSFNGSSQFISTAYAGVLGSGPRAVSYWAKRNGASSVPVVVWGSDPTGKRFDCGFGPHANGVTIDGAYAEIVYNAPANTQTAWHHYVFQFNTAVLNSVQVYQDGVLLTQTISTFNPATALNTTSSYNVHFGHFPFTSPFYYNGLLDDIGIWNRTLTYCEIQLLYKASANIVNVVSSNSIICSGQSANLTASGASTYTWNTSSNSPNITVSPTVNTSYMVTGTTAGNCVASAFVNITVNTCTGINEGSSLLHEKEIFPNPTSGKLTINVTNAISQLSIYDSSGNLIYKSSGLKETIEVDLTTQPAGIYLVKINSSNSTSITKIVKQ